MGGSGLWLRMSKFNGGKADEAGALDGHVDATCFAFSCRYHYVLDGAAHYVDWCKFHLSGCFSL